MELRYKGYTLGGGSGGGSGVPPGFIGMWSGETVPDGWALCDGTNGTPDLRGRFVLGESDDHAMGETGGSEEVTLTVEQMPKHNHYERNRASVGSGTQNILYTTSSSDGISGRLFKQDAFETASGNTKQLTTKDTGSGEPHPNMPPYYVLAFIMKL